MLCWQSDSKNTWECLQNWDADVDNGLVDTAGEGEGGTNWESSTDIYILPGIYICIK